MTSVSAIIVNFNAGPMLCGTIRALLDSPSVGEVIVVDNASDDDSLDAIDRMNGLPARLIIVRNDHNLGFSKACNIGISKTGHSDFLLFLNPDCLMAPGALHTLTSALTTCPKGGMAGPMLLNPDGSEQAGGRRAVPTPWRSFVRIFGLSRLGKRYPKLFSDFVLNREAVPEGPVGVEAISGACMLVKREALEDIGPMDEKYFLHCEDLDWCMRFHQRGWKILFVPGARAIHHQGTCSESRPLFVEWHKHRGMVRFYEKFFRHQYPGILLWMVKAGVWIRFSLLSVYYGAKAIRGRLKK
jgi:hypothetical protein